LQQLPYLTAALSEARKFGGCFVIGIQSYAQLGKVYGYEGAREISSLLNTSFMFRVPDPEMAQWSAKNLGETTFEEVREGISYGANSIRDGVSINRIEREKPVVTCSEILRLEISSVMYAYPEAIPSQSFICLISTDLHIMYPLRQENLIKTVYVKKYCNWLTKYKGNPVSLPRYRLLN
jgi:hypothetical protein